LARPEQRRENSLEHSCDANATAIRSDDDRGATSRPIGVGACAPAGVAAAPSREKEAVPTPEPE